MELVRCYKCARIVGTHWNWWNELYVTDAHIGDPDPMGQPVECEGSNMSYYSSQIVQPTAQLADGTTVELT